MAAVYTILDKQRPAEDDFWLCLTPEQQAHIEAGRRIPAKSVVARSY